MQKFKHYKKLCRFCHNFFDKRYYRGLCNACYDWLKRHIPEALPYIQLPFIRYKKCLIKGCINKHKAKGYCLFHWLKIVSEPRNFLKIFKCKRCKEIKTNDKHNGRGLCETCYSYVTREDNLYKYPLQCTKSMFTHPIQKKIKLLIDLWEIEGFVNSKNWHERCELNKSYETASRSFERLKHYIKNYIKRTNEGIKITKLEELKRDLKRRFKK